MRNAAPANHGLPLRDSFPTRLPIGARPNVLWQARETVEETETVGTETLDPYGTPPWERRGLVLELRRDRDTALQPGQLLDELTALLVCATLARRRTGRPVDALVRLVDAPESFGLGVQRTREWLSLPTSIELIRERLSRMHPVRSGDPRDSYLVLLGGTTGADLAAQPVYATLTRDAANTAGMAPEGLVAGRWTVDPPRRVADTTGHLSCAPGTTRLLTGTLRQLHEEGRTVGASVEPIVFGQPAATGRDDRLDFMLLTLLLALENSAFHAE